MSMALHKTIYITACMAIVLAMLTSNLKQAVASTFLWVSGLWRTSPTTMAIKLEEVTIAQLLAGLEQGHFTVTELVETYAARIGHLNPRVRAITQVNPDAISIARRKDAERSSGASLGILHGVPVLVKDVFLTKDGLMSTNGCLGLTEAVPAFEATIVRRLREQGAVLLGKTNPTEWANYRSPGRASGGWSGVGGQCLAPYHEDQDPSGSSSGSAVAACLGLAAAALGTETSGSLSSPAQKSAVISIKPTVGLTSRHGAYLVSEWQDTVGVLARTVQDAATVLTAIAGIDPNDHFTISDPRDDSNTQKPKEGTNFAHACTKRGLEGKRIAASSPRALSIMRAQGATIVDNVRFSEFNSNYTFSEDLDWTLGLRVSIRENMRKSLSCYESNPKSLHTLEDVIKYTLKTPEERPDDWGVDEWLKCEELGLKYGPDSPEFADSTALRNNIGKQIAELLDRTECDFIFAPSIDTSANVGGCPTIGVPLGFYPKDHPIARRKSNGLVTTGPNVPFGGLFVGRRWADSNLIAAAYAFEQASLIRDLVPPIVSSDIQLPLRKGEKIRESL
ncbi:hypothetical protein H9Q72_007592 [Fusarium xylarioides]|uniref:Amidase domain-containing protein n=1 Tax=Fusarium xylarioides TaxID=221167 RepID=A0A9P7HR85_9HYPO|nr:hypothetical protein H9Q72_007592 [Fusarium xylarioides]KAG5813674.1 hypothetical protein H9Q71_003626 [Fusarium xylarioides]KAG5813796.1 hypothetical protein H9Q74_012553 [Fusarium xylarioides]